MNVSVKYEYVLDYVQLYACVLWCTYVFVFVLATYQNKQFLVWPLELDWSLGYGQGQGVRWDG